MLLRGAEIIQRQLHNPNPPQHGWQLIKAENLGLRAQLVGSLTGWRIAHPRRSIVWFSLWGKKIFIHLCPRRETHLYIFLSLILPSLPGHLPLSYFSFFLSLSLSLLPSCSLSPSCSPRSFFISFLLLSIPPVIFFFVLLPIPPVLFILSSHLLSFSLGWLRHTLLQLITTLFLLNWQAPPTSFVPFFKNGAHYGALSSVTVGVLPFLFMEIKIIASMQRPL